MERGRLLVVLMLVCVCEVCVCQHWSYGWLPGGKRSIGGELEATFRMMNGGDTIIPLADEKSQPYEVVNDELEENVARRGRGPFRRVLLD